MQTAPLTPSHLAASTFALALGFAITMPPSDLEAAEPIDAYWAFEVPQPVEIPAVSRESAPENPIDAFILARLDAAGLSLSPEAPPATLLRRLHLDLTGLLPTPEETGRFLEAWDRDAEAAHRAEVDRLLDSPHFGERWGKHWLDLARYGDSDGYLGDTERAWAWRYRDWVVDAVNRDQPFDQFSIEQIAGDLLPEATEAQRIATGFHRNAMRNTEAGVDLELSRTQEVIDRLNTTATTWLALSVACAECHNHKHDPVKQSEFFELYAFFNNAEAQDINAPFPEEIESYRSRLAAWEESAAEHETRLAAHETETLAPGRDAWAEAQRRRLAGTGASTNPAWTVLQPLSADSGASDTMEIRDDGSVHVTGRRGQDPDSATYTLKLALPEGATRLSALRLEALGGFGEGRATGSDAGRGSGGSFVVSHLGLRLVSGEESRTLPFAAVVASHHDEDSDPAAALDSKSEEGWAVSGRPRESHAALFLLPEAAELEGADHLLVSLPHKAGKKTTLRHFRLSLASDPLPAAEGVETLVETLPDEFVAQLLGAAGTGSDADEPLLARHHRASDPEWAAQRLAFERHLEKKPASPRTLAPVMTERRDERRESYVHLRGDYSARGESVAPGVPASLHPLPPREDGAEHDRLDLARWLFEEDNPLTARVAANQIWQHLFGNGIVETSDDFGTEGARPTHPELLDWLALEFRRLGWSRKALIRLIVHSEAYRQDSAIPAHAGAEREDNTLLWRQNRFRVDAEVVRDIHLAASGLLSTKLGGPPVRPPLPAFVTDVGRSVQWPESKGEDRYRRGLYIFLKRTVMYPTLVAFDAPETDVACSRRDRSNSPMQALALLNDPVFQECSEHLGEALHQRHGDDLDAALEELFQRALARSPDEPEAEALRSAHREFLAQVPAPAALGATARIVMNLDEFISRE